MTWEHSTYMDVHGTEQSVIRGISATNHIIAQINFIHYDNKPDSRDAIIRQIHKLPPRKPRINYDPGAEFLSENGFDWQRSFSAVVYPENSAPVTIGSFQEEAEAISAVENWWAHWFGRLNNLTQ